MPKLGGRREPAAAVAGIQPQGAVAAPADQIDWAVAVDLTRSNDNGHQLPAVAIWTDRARPPPGRPG
jgi:hypothetical protein